MEISGDPIGVTEMGVKHEGKQEQDVGPAVSFTRGRELMKGYRQKFRSWGGLEQTISLASLLGLFISITAPTMALVVSTWLATVTILLIGSTYRRYSFGRYISARYLLLLLPPVASSVSAQYFALATIFALAIGMEAALKKPLETLPSEPGANFGEMRGLPRKRVTNLSFGTFGFVLLLEALFVTVALMAIPTWLAWLAAALALVLQLNIAFVMKWFRAVHHKMATEKHFWLGELKPQFYLHWDGPDSGIYQITMWAEYLERLEIPYAVVIRKDRLVSVLATQITAPILHVGDMEDVERSIHDSLKAVVYVNTALKNAHYIRFTHLTHIQINHGDSDKPASVSPAFRMFDFNLVAGQAAVDRFASKEIWMPDQLIQVVGRPQVERIAAREGGRQVETVLYAPTWAGYFGDSNLSSLGQGIAIIEQLLQRGLRVIFRPHAFTERDKKLSDRAEEIREILRSDNVRNGSEHIFGARAETEWSIYDCFNASDALISDISSIVTDYLFSSKPLALVAARTSQQDFRRNFPIARGLPVIEGDLGNLVAVLNDLTGRDTHEATRMSLRNYYLGDFSRNGYSQHFVDTLRRCIVTP